MLRSVALLVNPRAGAGRAGRAARIAAVALESAGVRVQVLTGTDARQTLSLATAAVSAGADALVVVGGDGTVHLAVQALAGQAVPLGVIPAGTGNDSARTLGLPLDPASAVQAVLTCRPWRADLARAGTRWYLGVLAAGLDARVNERANRAPTPTRRWRYELALLGELPGLRALSYQLDLDGQVLHARGTLVAVGNGSSYGGGMRICAGARLDDGRLDVVLVSPLTRRQLLRLFPLVYSGAHLSHPAVRQHRVRRVRLDAPGVAAYADGERVGPLPLDVEVVAGALRVLAPPPPHAAVD